MFAPRVCFVDVETTGSSPGREHVIEVAVVTVETDDEATRVSEWSSLVNPGVPIPGEIQWLTGIRTDMVRGAPAFSDIAEHLAALLHDGIFVGHNVRFDYGFLKAEFARVGIRFSARTLCTVRLSRLLYPDRSPHTLDAIILRFGLDGEQRHRALGDARVLWRLLQRLDQRHGREELERAVRLLLSRPATPPALPPQALDEVPDAPGVYLFFGANPGTAGDTAHPLYIGKSVAMRSRIAAHFSSDSRSATDAKLSQQVQRLEWEETAGEIGAWLRECELIKTRLPAHNIALRRRINQVFVALDGDRPRFRRALDVALDEVPTLFGPYASRASARAHLLHLAGSEGLCARRMRLEARGRGSAADAPCFNFQLHRCRGACVGAESHQAHTERLAALLSARRVPAWPCAGAVAIVERNAERCREDVHVFDRWCWLGTVRTLDAAAALAGRPMRQFDADVYRIAREALARAARGQLQLIELTNAAPHRAAPSVAQPRANVAPAVGG